MVVGDIDVDYIEAKIKELFSVIPKKENPPVKEIITIPDNESPEVCLFTDPELYITIPALIVKGEAIPEQYNSYGMGILARLSRNLIGSMINERLQDASKEPNSLFSQAYFGVQNMAKTMDAVMLQAVPKDNNKAMDALAGAIEIVRTANTYGFNQAEFDRAKTSILRRYEAAVDNAQTRRNGSYAMDYVSYFLENEPYMEPEYAKNVVEQYLNILDLNTINSTLTQPQSQFITAKNSVIYYSAPQKEGIVVPTESQILEAYTAALNKEVKPLESNEVVEPLLDASTIKSGKIKKTEKGFLGSTIYTLSNGIKVYCYPTDVNKDRMMVRLAQKGGESTLPLELLPVFEGNIQSTYSGDLGLGKFSENHLNKILTGKRASVSFNLNDYASLVNASGSPKDIETIFQLLYMQYTQPRCTDEEFNNSLSTLKLVADNLEVLVDSGSVNGSCRLAEVCIIGNVKRICRIFFFKLYRRAFGINFKDIGIDACPFAVCPADNFVCGVDKGYRLFACEGNYIVFAVFALCELADTVADDLEFIFAFVVEDCIVSVAFVIDERIRAFAAGERVVAFAAFDSVIVIAAGNVIGFAVADNVNVLFDCGGINGFDVVVIVVVCFAVLGNIESVFVVVLKKGCGLIVIAEFNRLRIFVRDAVRIFPSDDRPVFFGIQDSERALSGTRSERKDYIISFGRNFGSARREFDNILFGVVGNGVVAVAECINKSICAGTAFQFVVTCAAFEGIGTAVAGQCVVACTAFEIIGIAPARKIIIAVCTLNTRHIVSPFKNKIHIITLHPNR